MVALNYQTAKETRPNQISWSSSAVGGLAPDADGGWQRKFDDPIPLPNGRTFVTLHEPASYMVDLG